MKDVGEVRYGWNLDGITKPCSQTSGEHARSLLTADALCVCV